MSRESVRETLESEIQLGSIRRLAEGFKRTDYSGRLHRQIAQSIRCIIANAQDPLIRVEGVTALGLYANGIGYGWHCRPRVQAEILDILTTIGEKDQAMTVKEAALEQLGNRLERPNLGGRMHELAVNGIRRMSLSVTVTEKDSPEDDFIYHSLVRLGAFVKIRGSELSYRSAIKSQAASAIDYITLTAGVRSFQDLTP